MVRGDHGGGAADALVLHTERSGEAPLEGRVSDGCQRPRSGFAWQAEDGSLTPVRCESPNKCLYCSWLTAVENVAVIRADADLCVPRIGFTLTTRSASTPPKVFRENVAVTMRAVRREPWAKDMRNLGQVEFTTGRGKNSGGARRPHLHGLVKDVDPERAQDLADVMRRTWLPLTGAHRVEAHELHKPAGAIAYLYNHHQKLAQLPSRGWTGTRHRPSVATKHRRGYYERPIKTMREEAVSMLRDRRARHAVEQYLDPSNVWRENDPDGFYDARAELLDNVRNSPPVLVRTQRVPDTWNDDDTPASFRTEVLGPAEEFRL